jgi:hypothetical protein
LEGVRAPLYGVPGNHDHWSGADFGQIGRSFAKTGGAWLVDASARLLNGAVNLIGIDRVPDTFALPAGTRNILLMHYPAWVERLGAHRFDLILAGHSHGGQVRLPFFGPLIVPFNVGRYDLGLYQTPAGPLYVGAGIGWFHLPVRFNCRPEITVIEM